MTSFSHSFKFLMGRVNVFCSQDKLYIYYATPFEQCFIGEFNHTINLDQAKSELKKCVKNVTVLCLNQFFINNSQGFFYDRNNTQ